MNRPFLEVPVPTRHCPLESFIEEELVRIELQVARRADQLARTFGTGREKDLSHWIQAEHECWDFLR